jgi:hypothetical protein
MDDIKRITPLEWALATITVLIALYDPRFFGQALGSQTVISILFSTIFFGRLRKLGVIKSIFLFISSTFVVCLTQAILIGIIFEQYLPRDASFIIPIFTGFLYCYLTTKTPKRKQTL